MHVRAAIASSFLWVSAALADVDRLVDAMGFPQFIDAFVAEGAQGAEAINDGFLAGQGGAVWLETARRIYDAERLETELREGLRTALDDETVAQALSFFESDLGARLIDLEVQARMAMIDEAVEATAKTVGEDASEEVIAFIAQRNLIERNTDIAFDAQLAFFDGLAAGGAPEIQMPDEDGTRAALANETEAWLRGYYSLAFSALSEDEVEIYTAYYDTETAEAIDAAVFDVFSESYRTLSFALGQSVARLLPQNEL